MRTFLAALLLCLSASALAHQAPSGWAYPMECCSDKDCFALPDDAVEEDAAGFTIHIGDEIFSVSRNRARVSPDGRYHACRMEGARELLCFFYPPKGV